MRLKPIAEGAPKHAGVGARRSALHHEMFRIEKVGGVALVKREKLQSRQGTKKRCSPLPTVAQKILYTEIAGAYWMPVDGRGVPVLKAKISARVIGGFIAPGILPLASFRRAVSGAMPLLFGGEFFARPACVCPGFGMT